MEDLIKQRLESSDGGVDDTKPSDKSVAVRRGRQGSGGGGGGSSVEGSLLRV